MKQKLKILIVTHWFYPRQVPRAFRAYELYHQLKTNSIVDVVIGDWKVFLKNDDNCSEKLDKYNSKKIINKNAKLSNNRSIQRLKKIIQYFIGERYLITSSKFVASSINLQNYDAVISIGLPFYIHWMTARAVKKYINSGGKIISISDWGDPFVGEPDYKLAPYFKQLQKKVCKTFDYIVTPTIQAVPYYLNYVDNSKIKVIPQGINFEEVETTPYKKNKVPHFAYAGIFYSDKRNPEGFLEFLCSVKEDFVFTIYTIKHGSMYQDVLVKYETKLAGKLVIHDMIPRLECIKELSKNDFLINIDNLSMVQIPSKLIDYALSKRPVLSFSQNNIPEDKLYSFLHGDYRDALNIDVNQFDIKKVTEQFLYLIKREESNE